MTAPNVQVWAAPGTANEVYLKDLGDYQLSRVRGEIGTVQLSYPRQGQGFPLLESVLQPGAELEIAIRTDGTAASEKRAILLTGKGDLTIPGSSWDFTGSFLAVLLAAAVTLPRNDGENGDTVLSGTAGQIMVTLMQRAQEIGLLPGITYDFTATKDSRGQNWAQSISSVKWSPGRDYVSILQEIENELQLAEWELTDSRVLRLYNPGARGVDRTVPPASQQVTLEWGRDLVDAPATGSNIESGTRVMGYGADGLHAMATNAGAEAVRGRPIVVYRSWNNVTDQGTLDALVQAEASIVALGEHEYSHELTLAPGCPVPGVDFDISDWVLRAVRGQTERLQVAQHVLRRSSGVVTATISLGDLIDAHEVKTRRIIERLSNGSAVVGTSTPAPDVDDGKAPAAPISLTGSSVAYKQDGDTLVSVQVGWAAVTKNADGTDTNDILRYQVEYRQPSAEVEIPWTPVGTPAIAFFQFGNVLPNIAIEIRVLAEDKFGNLSAWSATLPLVTEADETPPPKPAAPTGTIDLGRVIIEFSEKADDGSAMPLDYDEWELHRSESASYTPDATTLVTVHPRGTKRSQWTPPGPESYGVAQYFRIVALDRDRNRSVPSNVLEAIPTAIGFADLPYKDNGNLVLDGSFEDPSGRTQNGDRSHPAWSFVEGSGSDLANHGTWFARADATQTGARTLLLSDRIPVSPGQQFVQRAAIRRNAAANGIFSLIMRFWKPDESFVDSAGNYATTDIPVGVWTEKTVSYHTVPAGAVSADVRVQLSGTATAGLWDVDRVETREALGTLLIQDAAITNAKVANLSVGKLISGELSAIIALLGEIRTANAPNARVVINADGIRKYDSSNVLRFEVTEDTTMIDGTLITGKAGESRIEVGNQSAGRDNIVVYDNTNKIIVAIGQVYDAETNAPTSNGILVQENVNNGRDIFQVYGSGPDIARLFFDGRTAALTCRTGQNVARGGFLALRFPDDGDTTFGRTLANGNAAQLFINSSGTMIFNIAGANYAEVNTNGMIASRYRSYGTASGRAAIAAADGDDICFVWSNGLRIHVHSTGAFIKNFVIDHPDDPDRWLVHGCTESPHAGVEYWGEAEIVGGQAVVELPPYFESLTRLEDRQVQVSVVLPDEPMEQPGLPPEHGPLVEGAPWPPLPPPSGVPEWGLLCKAAASRPRDGRFRIACDGPDGTKVAWLVKAVRKDVAPLNPEPLRSEVDVHGTGPYTYLSPRAA